MIYQNILIFDENAVFKYLRNDDGCVYIDCGSFDGLSLSWNP